MLTTLYQMPSQCGGAAGMWCDCVLASVGSVVYVRVCAGGSVSVVLCGVVLLLLDGVCVITPAAGWRVLFFVGWSRARCSFASCLLLSVLLLLFFHDYHGLAKHVDFISRLEINVDLRLFGTSMAKTLKKRLKGLMPAFDIHSDLKNQITRLTNPGLFDANKVKRLVSAHLCEKA
ncbi:hypothetical protein IFM89_027193 [Coptis chinensis]|uniref:Uncharacterized protein n=1 Tax=Coptis chinensis TaxID=261450 RepID=A0A835LWR5_9MAGN|nr:hypothetical protein IFM89_027193 [Coptis chinensis]